MKDVEKSEVAAPEGSAAREEQEMNEKDERIRALIHKRKNIAKPKKIRYAKSAKKSKSASETK